VRFWRPSGQTARAGRDCAPFHVPRKHANICDADASRTNRRRLGDCVLTHACTIPVPATRVSGIIGVGTCRELTLRHSGSRWRSPMPIGLRRSVGLHRPDRTRRPAAVRRRASTARTALCEVGLGRFVAGNSWPEILEQYDLPHGRVWVLVQLWIAIGPATVRELRTRRAGR
jgi:hypothetical protein